MPRKSSRQPSKTKRHSPAILSRKRKHDSDDDLISATCITMRSRFESGSSSSGKSSGASVASTELHCSSSDDPSVVEIIDDVPSSAEVVEVTSSDSITPERECCPSDDVIADTWSNFASLTCSPCTPVRASPIPFLFWTDSREVWNTLVRKDRDYKRDADLMSRHPALLPRMRSILLDWLIEVCEVYRLHRETFFLALDFVDRYLSIERDLPKSHLQLLGITALFIAAKLEEIYPPKIGEFAYVTDEACSERNILDQELVMLQKLSWDLCPITPSRWVTMYLQLQALHNKSSNSGVPDSYVRDPPSFLHPQFSALEYVQIAKLLDLVVLDMGSLNYPYSVLSAAALSYYINRKELLKVSGFRWSEISECVSWMAPFAEVVSEDGPSPVKTFSDVSSENYHNIQTHVINLKLLERARTRQKEQRVRTSSESSSSILTPPKSCHKPAKRARTGSISNC